MAWTRTESLRYVTLTRLEVAKMLVLQDDLIKAINGSLSKTQLATSITQAGLSLAQKVFSIGGTPTAIAGHIINAFAAIATAERQAVLESVTYGRSWYISLNNSLARNPSWISLYAQAPFLKFVDNQTYVSFSVNHGQGVIKSVQTKTGTIEL